MITPAYAPTATERVLPRMALDFTTGVLDPRVTVTRALNTATRINSSGLVEIVNANLPRFDYDPTTLAPKGLLIEESRANLLLRSEEFDNVVWLKSATTVTANSATSPDGTTTADLVTSSGDGTIRQSAACAINTAYTGSVWLRVTSGTRNINLYRTDNGTGFATTVAAVTTTWQRFTLTATSSATATLAFFQIGGGSSLPNGATVLVWGAQLEAGAFATSYIPTTTTSLTRNADDVTMTGTNFTSWYNQSQGALSVKYLKSTTQVSGRYVARFFSPTVGAGVSYWINSNGIDTRYWIGATNASLGNGSLVNVNTGAFSYKTATSTGALNGAANVANGGTVPLDVTEFRIGDAGGINAHIQRILYWPFALTAAEIRANSKG